MLGIKTNSGPALNLNLQQKFNPQMCKVFCPTFAPNKINKIVNNRKPNKVFNMIVAMWQEKLQKG